MQWDKVKTILLVILLAVDGFLGWTLSWNAFTAARRDRETLETVRILAEREGVTLGEGFVLPVGFVLPALEAERSTAAEEETAAALLGSGLLRTEEEDGTLSFESEEGAFLRFHRDGSIEGRLPCEENPTDEAARLAAAEQLLQSFPTHGGALHAEETAVVLEAPVAGAPVFDRQLTLRFEEGWAELAGRWTLRLPYTTTGSELYYDAADALLTYACGAESAQTVRAMTLGYRLGEETAGRIPLVVCWKIVTDEGILYLDTSKMTIHTEEIS